MILDVEKVGENTAYLQELERKRQADLLHLEGKRGKEFYSDDWVDSRKKNVNTRADDAIDKNKKDEKTELRRITDEERDRKAAIAVAKENVAAIKETAAKNIKAITAGDAKLVDVVSGANTAEEKLIARITDEGVTARKDKGSNPGEGRNDNFLKSLISVENLNRVVGNVSQLANSQNGFDNIQRVNSILGNTTTFAACKVVHFSTAIVVHNSTGTCICIR